MMEEDTTIDSDEDLPSVIGGKSVLVQLIQDCVCDLDLHETTHHRALLIGCSGGGGHNAAIVALAQFLRKKGVMTPEHQPTSYEQTPSSLAAIGIHAVAYMLQLSNYARKFCDALGLPSIPDLKKIRQKIEELKNHNKATRVYIDLFLDACRSGYENVAIWDILQCEDQKEALVNLVRWQSENDRLHKQDFYRYFLQKLCDAKEVNQPYTVIVSTQPNGLAALCKAVYEYNRRYGEHVVVHQYITDMPSGSSHFFRALAHLKPYQQAQIKLYGVNMQPAVLNKFFSNKYAFAGIYNIAPAVNPMVREAFSDPRYDYSGCYHEACVIPITDEYRRTIEADSHVASIMLGSQAGNDTLRYIPTLLAHGMQTVFIFAGNNQALKDRIQARWSGDPRVVILGPQQPPVIKMVMTRSRVVIIRGGGLTVMEQELIPHMKDQVIFIHHADVSAEATPVNGDSLTSGIVWEDSNVDDLADYLSISVIKTTPRLIKRELDELFGPPEEDFDEEWDMMAPDDPDEEWDKLDTSWTT